MVAFPRGNRRHTALGICAALALSACASTPQSMKRGVAAYNAGQNGVAAQQFMECAAQGVPECMYNLGVMFESRKIASANPNADAVRWYYFAARHGQPEARASLVRLRVGVPPADLAPAPYQPTQEEAEAAGALGELVGTAIGGGFRR